MRNITITLSYAEAFELRELLLNIDVDNDGTDAQQNIYGSIMVQLSEQMRHY